MIALGLDASTQSFSGVIYDSSTRKTLHSHSINFGEHLPHHGAPNGYLTNKSNRGAEYLAKPQMWLDGLDLLLSEMKAQGAILNQIERIAGTAQQHATVYTNDQLHTTLSQLSPTPDLPPWVPPKSPQEPDSLKHFQKH